MPLVYVDSSYLRKLEKDENKIRRIGAIMSKRFGDGSYRGEDPEMDEVFDLIDDLLNIEGKDRCDYAG